eukprot:8989552-Pyramimonas_sp.AAC.1
MVRTFQSTSGMSRTGWAMASSKMPRARSSSATLCSSSANCTHACEKGGIHRHEGALAVAT